MRWGSIDCLKDSTRCLRISNRSPIAASLQVFLRLLRSKFELKVESIVLEAGEEYDLEVTANLDDSVVVKEELHIMVAEGEISSFKLLRAMVMHLHMCGVIHQTNRPR